MNPPENKANPQLNPTPWELAMSAATGKKPSFFRVPRDNPAVLSKEQQVMMRDLVTPGSNAHKLFSKAVPKNEEN